MFRYQVRSILDIEVPEAPDGDGQRGPKTIQMDIPPDVITPASVHQQSKQSKQAPGFDTSLLSSQQGGSVKNNHVSTVILYGVPIVSLIIETQERLCLAQISNTLLKDFSYNEIHNRRVALGDNSPPRLPEDFAFSVYHECAWGCKGSFLPSRYNSSRAKCIKCIICGLFFSPNKFIFHSHRLSTSAKYIQPDAANFNSWRRHLRLVGCPHDDIVHAWEDVKAMFNGGMCNRGTRKRINPPGAITPRPHSDGKSKHPKPNNNDPSITHPSNNNNNNNNIKDLTTFTSNNILPTTLSRISSALPNLDFWHRNQTGAGNNVSNTGGIKSFPQSAAAAAAAAATFNSMAAAMLPTWYYNYHTASSQSTPVSPNSSAFRPVYPTYLSYLSKLSPASESEDVEDHCEDHIESYSGGGDVVENGDDDSDVTVDIETCTPDEETEVMTDGDADPGTRKVLGSHVTDQCSIHSAVFGFLTIDDRVFSSPGGRCEIGTERL
ncbi:hypothetical protein WDU94_010563 [Cyamophila willieti]